MNTFYFVQIIAGIGLLTLWAYVMGVSFKSTSTASFVASLIGIIISIFVAFAGVAGFVSTL